MGGSGRMSRGLFGWKVLVLVVTVLAVLMLEGVGVRGGLGIGMWL